MSRSLERRTIDITESLVRADLEKTDSGSDLWIALEGLESLIGSAKSVGRRIIFSSGDGVVGITKYVEGPGARSQVSGSSLALQSHSLLVLGGSVLFVDKDSSKQSGAYVEQLYVGDAQFAVRAFAVTNALRNSGALNVESRE